ncbi:pyrimidine 5-nucleotidase [Phellopilus nigrolimitatus]|nr:pyrimidine 5-nucleotidase [Phellopilus nigrolimitatus]
MDPPADDRAIVWFDIDNTLYSASSNIADAMGQRIHAYFVSLGLDDAEASALHLKYYKTYGLALRGLVRHHDVDTLDFDRRCDGMLPLEEMIHPNPAVRKLLQDIDRSKVRVWALTNAYVTHARRVLRILEIEDQFEGVVFCDYAQKDFFCKPEPEFYHAAMKKARATDPSKCYFIDDSKTNVDAARRLSWGRCVHFCETGLETTEGGVKRTIHSVTPGRGTTDLGERIQVDTLEGLRTVWPELFKGSR